MENERLKGVSGGSHLLYVEANHGTAQFQLETVYRLQLALPPSLK
jgi:hypothetical protein